jgi:phospholipase D1/2
MVNKAVVVRPSTACGSISGYVVPAFEVLLAGDFDAAQQELTFHLVDTNWNQHPVCPDTLWKVSGSWAPLDSDPHHFQLAAPDSPDKIDKPDTVPPPVVAFAFKPGAGVADFLYFALPSFGPIHKSGPGQVTGFFEGDSWELEIHADGGNVKSPLFAILWNAHVVPPGGQREKPYADSPEATYDWHAGNRVTFYNDACESLDGKSGYFADLNAAILAANKFIFVVDWSFHPSMMIQGGDYTAANTIGALLLKQAQSGVTVAVLTWLHVGPSRAEQQFSPTDVPNDTMGDVLRAIASAAGLGDGSEVLWRTDYRKQGFSHHQKFVVMDDGTGRAELKVFYGGIDLTKGRYDCSDHPVMASAAGKRFWSSMTCNGVPYNDWYNNEWSEYSLDPQLPPDAAFTSVAPREPWHDVHAQLQGPVAWDFAREFVTRWRTVTSASQGSIDSASIQRIEKLFASLFDRGNFVQQWERQPSDRKWAAQLLHSIEQMHWSAEWDNPGWGAKRKESVWGPKGQPFERSIQNSYLRAIARAERFIHIENQYFIGSGALWGKGRLARSTVTNAIPEALVNRIKYMIGKGRDFHVYIHIPMMPEGGAVPSIGNVNPGIRALEWRTIGYMIDEVRQAAQAKGKIWSEFLSFYCLMRSDASGENGPPPGINHYTSRSATLNQARINLCRDNQRYMVYIHCKLMIVDDRFLILGSANGNERSMAGNRDTEICVALWPASSQVEADCENDIRKLRGRLVKEHMGGASAGFEAPEKAGFRQAYQALGQSNYRSLLAAPGGGQMTGHLTMLPFNVSANADTRIPPEWFQGDEITDPGHRHEYLIDSLRNHEQWKWRSDLNSGAGNAAARDLIE